MVSAPVKKDFEFDITRLIKWISVSGLDDSKSYCIEKMLTEKLDSFSTSNECEKIAYLGSTEKTNFPDSSSITIPDHAADNR